MSLDSPDFSGNVAVEPPVSTPAPATLTRDAILGAVDIQTERVDVPEWGGAVWVRGMTGRERDRFELTMVQQKGKVREVNLQNFRAKLVAMSVVESDQPGAPHLFSQADAAALADKSSAALTRVFNVAQKLSGVAPDEVEELVTGLGEDQSDASGSG